MSRIPTLLLILLQLVLFSTGLQSQNGICLDFEDLTPGDRIGRSSNLAAGDLFYRNNDVAVSLEAFQYPDGTSGFENVLVYNDSILNSNFRGTYLFPSNINIKFDFENFPLTINSHCFNFRYWGGDVNIGANGGDVLIASSLEELYALNGKEIGPGAILEIQPSSNDRASGNICIKGELKQFLIGGQEFGIDDLCIFTDDVLPVCSITDLKVKPHPCTPNGIFYLDVDFNVRGETSETYKITVNNQIFGPFPKIRDSILTVGPISPFGDEEFAVTVFDAEYNECQASTRFRQTCSNDCNITDVRIVLDLCQDDTDLFDDLIVDFKTDLPVSANQRFRLWVKDQDLGDFGLDQLPLRLPYSRALLTEDEIPFKLCFTPVPGGNECCIEGVIILKRCEEDCNISNIRAAAVDCSAAGTFNVALKFEAENTGDKGFTVLGFDGISYGTFRYADLPIKVGPFDRNMDYLGLVVVDNENRNCADTLVLDEIICTPDCEIEDVRAEIIRCRENGNFDIALKVGFKNDTDSPFEVYVDNQLIGVFTQADFPLFLRDIQVLSRATFFEVKVCPLPLPGTTSADCCKSVSLNKQDCPQTCNIEAVKAEITRCLPNGNFNLEVNVAFNDDQGIPFGIYVEGEFVGFYTPDELPLSLHDVPVYTDAEDFEVVACPIYFEGTDPATDECCKRVRVKKTPCPPFCNIRDIKAEIVNCYPTGNYDIQLKVWWQDEDAETPFRVFVDGKEVGSYRPGDLPLLLENVPVNTDAETFELRVCQIFPTDANVATNCCQSITLSKRRCQPECILEAVKAEIAECLPNGNFNIYVNVDYAAGYEGSPFVVYVEGELVARVDGKELPVLLEDVPVYTDATNFTVKACPISITTDATGILECCVETIVEKSPCPPGNEDCISFDDLASESYGGDVNPPGTEIFNLQDVSFRLLALQNLDWSTSYDKLEVVPADRISDFTNGSGQILVHEGISSIISFAGYPQAVEKVTLDYYFDGSHINLAANGGQIQIISYLSPGFYQLGNGVEVEIKTRDANSKQGQFIFYGNIQTLLIGGNRLAIDNLCINEKEDCKIGDLVLEPTRCDANGQFYLSLDFEYENTSDYFVVEENGLGLARYAYADLPVKLGPFQTPYEAGSIFRVYDSFHEDCSSRTEFGPYFCDFECEITGLEAYEIECIPERGVYNMTLAIKGENLDSLVTVTTKSGFTQTFIYTGRPIRIKDIPLTNRGVDGVEVCAGLRSSTGQAVCCASLEYELDCPPQCTITYAEVGEIECLADTSYNLTLKVDGAAVGDVLIVMTESGFRYKYEYTGRPERITNIPLPNSGKDWLKVCLANEIDSAGNAECCFDLDYEIPCSPKCEITDIKAYDFECDLNKGTYNVTLEIKGEHLGNTIKVVTESGFEARFQYSGRPIRLNDVPILEGGKDWLYVCAIPEVDSTATTGTCCFETSYEIPCAQGCSITDAKVYDIECDLANGVYHYTLDVKGRNLGDIIVVLTSDSSIYRYEYTGRPERISNITLPNGNLDWITVCAGYNPDGSLSFECCKDLEIAIPCSRTCEISAVEVSDIECLADTGLYSMTLEIKGENLGNVITIKTKSGYVARMQYTGRPIRVEGIPLTDRLWDGLTICAGIQPNDAASCCFEIEYELPCRLPCEIYGAEVYDFECETEKGVYHMTLAVKGENLGEVIHISTKSGFRYAFQYTGRPERISNIPLTDNKWETIYICAGPRPADGYDCCYELEYEVACTNDCNIRDIKVFDFDCTPDSIYSMSIQLVGNYPEREYYFKTESGFEAKIKLDSGFARIDGIPLVAAYDSFIICLENNRSCCFETKYDIPCRLPCDQLEVSVFDITCADDSTYSLSLKVGGLPDNFNDVLHLVTKSGFETRFKWEGEAIRLEGIPNFGWEEDAFQLCAPNYRDCCTEASYKVPCGSGGECRIGELWAEATPCENDGSFYIELDFRHENTSDGFEVYINGTSFEKYRYSALPVRVGPIRSGNVEEYEITVKDLEKDGCKQSTKVVACQPAGCSFSRISVEPIRCGDGVFYVEANILVENPQSDGYLVFAEGELFGPFRYDEKKLVILGPFAADGVSTYDFLFVDLGDPTCYGYKEIGPISCEEECNISEITAEVLNCNDDGSYRVFIDFWHEGADNEYFDIFTSNGEIVGTYKLDQLPLETDIVFPNDTNVQHLAVCINDNPDCCIRTEVSLPPCEPCEGLSFQAIPTECDENGMFKIDIKFDLDLTVIYPVVLEVNGEFYDSIEIANPEITIGPFISGEDYTITVINGWRPNCVSKMELGLIECQPDCGFEDLKIEAISCYPDGSYKVYIDFAFASTADQDKEFKLLDYAGDKVASFKLSELPIEVERVKIPKDAPYLGICVADNDCCVRTYVEFPECEPCNVQRAEVALIRCTADNEFYVGIRADWDLDNLDQYMVLEGDIAYPEMRRDDDGIVFVGPFTNRDTSTIKLEIVDLRNPLCVLDLAFKGIDCEDEEEDVWPGDANLDNIANHIDLLSLGIAWGMEGPVRPMNDASWTATPADAWGERFTTGTDFKHADCNGDGVVDEKDIEIILANYNRTHGTPTQPVELPSTDFDPPIFFDLPDNQDLPDSSYFTVPIVLGNEDQPLNDIYGVAFTIEFDPEVIDADQVEIKYPTSWLGEKGVNLASIDYTYPSDGVIEVAITRTDQNEVSGFGTVAYFKGIRDDIVGRYSGDIRISQSFAVRTSTEMINLSGLKTEIKFARPKPSVPQMGLIDLKRGMRVYPNPAYDIVTIDNFYNVPVDGLQILSTDGKVMSGVYKNTNQLDVSNLPEGLYIIRVDIGGFAIHQKLFKK